MKANNKTHWRFVTGSGLACGLVLSAINLSPAWADTNISFTEKYAWSENTGWWNLRPSTADGVNVGEKILTGYAWSENLGWINMGSGNPDVSGYYPNTTANNWGVNHNAVTGALSGYAWGENVGWINFGTGFTGVSISTGSYPRSFDGWAWGENIGWIQFSDINVPNNAQLSAPTKVDLVSFTARRGSAADTVQLEWRTCAELNHAGFHLWRSVKPKGGYHRITSELIGASGGVDDCEPYRYQDDRTNAGWGNHYRLEMLDNQGDSWFSAPIQAEQKPFSAIGRET